MEIESLTTDESSTTMAEVLPSMAQEAETGETSDYFLPPVPLETLILIFFFVLSFVLNLMSDLSWPEWLLCHEHSALRVEMHAALRSPSPSTSPLVTLRQKRRRSLEKIKVIYSFILGYCFYLHRLDMDVDKVPDNPKKVEPDSETVTNVESSKISSPDTTVARKEVGSPELERGVVNAALDLYDVIQLDFFFGANMSIIFINLKSETSAISGTRKKQKVMLKCGIHKLSDVLFVTYVFQEAVAAKAAGLVVIIYVRPRNGSCPITMDLIQSSLFRRYVGDMPKRVFHLVKRLIKVKLLPNGDYIQKEAALWVAFKPK
ncbi:hypothetical protein L1887_03950 [Cichorium endivia]|nr:hypothetical protein L1887_03950 [Cichorium endivia]